MEQKRLAHFVRFYIGSTMKLMILTTIVLVFFTGCSTTAYHATNVLNKFHYGHASQLYESPHYAGTKLNGELIVWPYSVHKPRHNARDFATDTAHGFFMWPFALLYGVIDFSFSLVADTLYYPIQLGMENNKRCAADPGQCPNSSSMATNRGHK